MLSNLSRSVIRTAASKKVAQQWMFKKAAAPTVVAATSNIIGKTTNSSSNLHSKYCHRLFSTGPSGGTQSQLSNNNDDFIPTAPSKLNYEIAEGIQEGTIFYLRNGVSYQRLKKLSEDIETCSNNELVLKWQKMMEIYLTTQVMVISGLGYEPNEQGLQTYTQQLANYMNSAECTNDDKEEFRKVGNETWRELVCTTFNLNPKTDIESISIVDARNNMHKVSTKMQDPETLMLIQKQCSKLEPNPDLELELAMKHQVLQNVIVSHVYLGGSPSIVEEAGYGPGPKGYAKMQCAMAEHEGDALMGQYAGSAMLKLWEAAGLDVTKMQPGAATGAVPTQK